MYAMPKVGGIYPRLFRWEHGRAGSVASAAPVHPRTKVQGPGTPPQLSPSGGVFLGREQVGLATTRRAPRHSRTIIPKLDALPTSAVNSGTQGDRTRCLWGPLAHQGWEQGGVTMQHELHWLDYDPVAVAVLAIGMGLIELFALLF
jgi:hypothetical protein